MGGRRIDGAVEDLAVGGRMLGQHHGQIDDVIDEDHRQRPVPPAQKDDRLALPTPEILGGEVLGARPEDGRRADNGVRQAVGRADAVDFLLAQRFGDRVDLLGRIGAHRLGDVGRLRDPVDGNAADVDHSLDAGGGGRLHDAASSGDVDPPHDVGIPLEYGRSVNDKVGSRGRLLHGRTIGDIGDDPGHAMVERGQPLLGEVDHLHRRPFGPEAPHHGAAEAAGSGNEHVLGRERQAHSCSIEYAG